MKKSIVKLTIVTLLVSLLFSSFCVSAKEPYASYYLKDGMAMKIPAPYEVVTVIDFKTKEEGRLSSPEDLFIGSDDMIYVADSGNDRIVVINPMNEDGVYTLNKIIKGVDTYSNGDMSALKDPRGIYVDDDGSIIVADYGNKRLVEFTKYGYFKYSYPTPEGNVLSSDFNYMPIKVTKDTRGYLYVANSSDSNGILMLDSDGTMRQYFGANKVTLTFWESIARILWNRESRKGSIVTLPYSFNNIYASDDGYIYATTTTATPPQVRKISVSGTDLIYNAKDMSDGAVSSSFGSTSAQIFCDVTVDSNNNMLIVDQQYGRIYEYNADGVNLFAFSTSGNGYGQLSFPCSIEVDSQNRIYVLNKNAGTITVFQATEFAQLIHEANNLYALGKYDEALPIWQKVLDQDSYYTLALENMGMIKLRQKEYDTAYNDYFLKAQDATDASTAFKEIRADFLRDNFTIIVVVIIALLLLWVVVLNIKRRRRRKYGIPPEKKTWFTPIKNFFKRLGNVIRHPIDTFECIRYEDQGSYGDMIAVMLLYTVFSVAAKYCESFIYRGGSPIEFIKPMNIIALAILPWLVVCIVNYGVTAIMYGEGRLRDIFIGGAYCHTPMLLVLPLALLTNVLTLDEQSLYNLIHTLLYVWLGILAYLCIKSVHGFHPIKGIVVTFITVLGVAFVILLALIVYGLAAQMFGFIGQFGKELSYLV